MKTVHVPDVIATGLIRSFQILKPRKDEAQTYYFHYVFDKQQDYEEYVEKFAPKLKAHPHQLFPNQFNVSRKIMERI